VAHYKHRLLLLIDEFASLKRLTVIEEALAWRGGVSWGFPRRWFALVDRQRTLKFCLELALAVGIRCGSRRNPGTMERRPTLRGPIGRRGVLRYLEGGSFEDCGGCAAVNGMF